MSRWLFVVAGVALALPASAQPSKPRYLPGSDHVCRANLSDGTPYEVWERQLLTEWGGQALDVKVRVYYKPGTGELLWRSTGYSRTGHDNPPAESLKGAGSACEEAYHHIVMLKDGEWADFWAERGRIVISHSTLKFRTRKEAWSYIAKHWRDGSDDPNASAKWVTEVLVYDQLGREFFRPKSLEFDARPFTYDPLIGVKKAGSTWELSIKGADEPNRAKIVLDDKFKVSTVTKTVPVDR